MSKGNQTKYVFENSDGIKGSNKQTAVVFSRTKEGATEKLCSELGVRELPITWRLVRFELK